MALTSRGTGWEILQTWYVLLTLPFGLLSWAAFFYTGFRAGRWKWYAAGLFYLVWFVAFIYLTDRYPSEEDRANVPWFDGFMWGYMLSWIGSIIHSLIIRKEFLLHLDARSTKKEQKTDHMKSAVQAQYGLSGNRVDEMLVEFKEDDLTVKLCGALFSVMPFAPDFRFYHNLRGATDRAGGDDQVYERAKMLATRDEFAGATKVVRGLDMVDSGLGIYTGFKNVYEHVKEKDRPRTFEADPQQAADAAVKLLGIAYMVATLFPGGVSEKVSQFLQTKAGKELAIYYAGVEVALPFTDNLMEGGADLVDRILAAQPGDVEQKFAEFSGGTPLDDARPVLMQLKDQITGLLSQVKMYVDPLTERVKTFVPQAMNVADSATGAVATGLDMMPTYRFLGARLAAEAAVLRAQRGE